MLKDKRPHLKKKEVFFITTTHQLLSFRVEAAKFTQLRYGLLPNPLFLWFAPMRFSFSSMPPQGPILMISEIIFFGWLLETWMSVKQMYRIKRFRLNYQICFSTNESYQTTLVDHKYCYCCSWIAITCYCLQSKYKHYLNDTYKKYFHMYALFDGIKFKILFHVIHTIALHYYVLIRKCQQNY